MKLLSRCAGSTRADAAAGCPRAARTASSTRRSACGSHATVVGQNAVTPKAGRRDAILRTRVPTPAGVQQGRLFRVDRFHALGAELSSFVVQALALNDEYGVDGLLGMNFLENYNFTVRPRDRQIHLEPVESGESPPAG